MKLAPPLEQYGAVSRFLGEGVAEAVLHLGNASRLPDHLLAQQGLQVGVQLGACLVDQVQHTPVKAAADDGGHLQGQPRLLR